MTDSNPVSSPQFVNGTPSWVQPLILQASQKYNIPTMLLSSLLKQESGFNPNAKSPVGALGIAQFMPETANGRGVDPLDPTSAINGAAQYLRQSWDQFGKPELALAAYNAGSGAVQQYGGIPPYKETQNYVKNIMAMAGDPHQSYNGPMLDALNEAKSESPSQNQGASSQTPTPPAYMVASPTPTAPQTPAAYMNAAQNRSTNIQLPPPSYTPPTSNPLPLTTSAQLMGRGSVGNLPANQINPNQ